MAASKELNSEFLSEEQLSDIAASVARRKQKRSALEKRLGNLLVSEGEKIMPQTCGSDMEPLTGREIMSRLKMRLQELAEYYLNNASTPSEVKALKRVRAAIKKLNLSITKDNIDKYIYLSHLLDIDNPPTREMLEQWITVR